MLAHTVKGVAKNDTRSDVGVVQRLDAHVVAGQKKTPSRRIPDAEGEIAEQALNTVFLPYSIRVQNQLDVGNICRYLASASFEFRDEIGTRVHARIGHDPHFFIQSERLSLALG